MLKNKIKGLSTLLLTLLIFSLPISSVCGSPHTIYGEPLGKPNNTLVLHNIYTLSNNPQTKFADWVAYIVSPLTLGNSKTSRNWKKDPMLSSAETLSPKDYTGAHKTLHTDRGHQAPLASFKGTPYWAETNYLSNITPQKSELNQGPWKCLEEYTRDLARMGYKVYVITGPLYEHEMPCLPACHNIYSVPSGYWKILAFEDHQEWKYFAFLMEQETPRKADWHKFQISIDEVESHCGLNFFHELPDSTETKVERVIYQLPIISKIPGSNSAQVENMNSSENGEIIVYITKSGKKYHCSSCSCLSKSRIPITLKEAKKAGYTPCKRCHPPE